MSPLDTKTRVHLNRRVEGLRPSATLAINEKCARLTEEGRKIYQLGFGQSPFPIPESVVEALRANAYRKSYLPVKGLPDLRHAVADFHRRHDGVNATGDDILIGPGSKELIFLLQLTCDADVLIPTPSWVSYEPQAQLLGRNVFRLQTKKENGWRLTPEELERACRHTPSRPRLLILNYPSNPTGLTFAAPELEGLANVAREHELLILSDEIYGELNHSGRHTSIAKYYAEGTIISSGLSKWCSAGGWRLGTFCFPSSLRWLLDAMATVASETYSCVSAPIQYAAVRAFEGGAEIERYVTQARRILRSLGQLVSGRLHVHPPEGGFYLFPDFGSHPTIKSSPEFCERLLNDTGVAMLPGSDFGRPFTELTCRLAYVDFDGVRCLEAAEEVPIDQELSDEFLTKHCPNVIEAIDLVTRWAC